MKRLSLFVLLIGMLWGCSGGQGDMEQTIALRQKLLSAKECLFNVDITADYGDKITAFSLDCTADSMGTLHFVVTAPETLSGISGEIRQGEGKLLFDKTALAFPLLADGELSPVSAPWIFLNTLRSGYLKSVGREGDCLHLTIDDSYREDALQLDIWTSAESVPVRCEILHNGSRILSLDVKNFQMQ